MLPLAFLAAAAVQDDAESFTPRRGGESVALTVAEIRHLLIALVLTPISVTAHVLGWSAWRRRVQARARRCHYQRRNTAAGARSGQWQP
jgi:hypothetical protein